MEREELERLIIDYIDGTLNDADRLRVEKELKENADSRQLYDDLVRLLSTIDKASPLQPSPAFYKNFHGQLKNEVGNARGGRVISMSTIYKAAAVILLVIVSGGVGYWISQQQKREREFVALQKEMELIKQNVMNKLDNDQSASQRILGVKAAYQVDALDDEIANALIKVMNEDPNSNVRLSAIEALTHFHEETRIRKALIESLQKQTDPVVQMALIQLMVEMKEKRALPSLKEIIEDEDVLPSVRDEAHAGILQLS